MTKVKDELWRRRRPLVSKKEEDPITDLRALAVYSVPKFLIKQRQGKKSVWLLNCILTIAELPKNFTCET